MGAIRSGPRAAQLRAGGPGATVTVELELEELKGD